MGDHSSEYSDFQHETINFAFEIAGDNSNYEVNVQPLNERGGLDSDEVAEIVGFKSTALINGDGETGGYNKEFRGAFGANLTYPADIPGSGAGGTPENNNNLIKSVETQSGTLAACEVSGVQENGILDTWETFIGGGSTGMIDSRFIDLREVYGRGPVLDTTDELSVLAAVISESGSTLAAEGIYRTHLIYDIATVEGVRNEFSLPETME